MEAINQLAEWNEINIFRYPSVSVLRSEAKRAVASVVYMCGPSGMLPVRCCDTTHIRGS